MRYTRVNAFVHGDGASGLTYYSGAAAATAKMTAPRLAPTALLFLAPRIKAPVAAPPHAGLTQSTLPRALSTEHETTVYNAAPPAVMGCTTKQFS